jgi:signal transduction histidine kinase/GAF domain-containing protein
MDSFDSGQWQVLQQVATGAPLPNVLESIVKLVESCSNGMHCSILLFDAERRTLRHGAVSALPAEYVRALDGTAIGPDAGSCGAAAHLGTRVIIEDIATHPNWAPYRHLALPHGLRACWSSPIFSAEHELLGTFAMYYLETRGPSEAELAWVSTATHLAAIAIVRDRSELALRQSEERLRVLNELGEAMRAESDPDRVLPIALRILGRHLRASRCLYANVGADDRCLIPHDYADGCASIAGEYSLTQFGEHTLSALLRGGDPIVVRDVNDQLGSDPRPELVKALGIRATITCSLIRDGALRAIVSVHQTTPRDWTRAEVGIVQEFAERCWAMIEQRAAEAKLRQNAALLRIAGQAAKLGGWTLELPELRLTWSDEVCAIHDVPAGSAPLLEQAIAFYTPEYRELIRSSLAACALEGKGFDLEADFITAKGRPLRIRAIGHAERDAEGAISRVLGAFQDVEDRKKLEEQLRHAQKMEAIGRLAGSIAHDFNNLLSVILSYSELVLLDLSPGSSLRGDVDAIKRAGERAADLTRQLLAFSRRQVLSPKVLDLNTVLREAERILMRLLGEDIELVTRLDSHLAKVKVDPGQIDQVIMNLAVNARDAMPSGGKLILETKDVFLDESYAREHVGISAGAHVQLAISDTGQGMDKATQARIFEPFFTTKEQGKGTGLGLSTVFGIVQQSGGSIWVYSEPNRGTTFKIYFPKAAEPASPRADPALPESLEGTETVLLVEDQDEVRQVAREILRRYGYDVIETRSPGEAVLACERHPRAIHLLLTDVVMPKMNGRELAGRLLLLRPNLRVLYMSGYTDDAIVHHGVLDSNVAYLQKPLVPITLARRVREVLDG